MDTNDSEMISFENIVKDILGTIDKDREREIISRRYGLYDRKETLEQIGELLNITRERVRQLEKTIINRLKIAAEKDLPHIKNAEHLVQKELENAGHVMRVSDLTKKITGKSDKLDQSRLSFIAHLAPSLSVIEDNDNFYHTIASKLKNDEKKIYESVNEIIEAVKNIGEPTSINAIKERIDHEDDKYVLALASISKQLASLNGKWGLIKWPLVNPKNIRDKIYVVLKEKGSPLHFNEIAKSIKDSEFRRKDVTTQAIHNELIKDKRFVLIGRGIYALNEWGYSKGTVADIIAHVLEVAGEPLHRDEIVKRVLESRQVKETTILLNLQGKDRFKRVAKATYALAN